MESQSDHPRKQIVIGGDYRLTRVREGIKIEVLDYHADPLVLSDAVLMEWLATGREH